jgi:hypothetical protein
MEMILQIFKQLPPFWPRLAALVVLVLLVALPQTRSLLKRRGARLDRAKRLLELRKLEIEVAKLRASVPEAGESVLDAQIQAILGKELAEEDEPPLAWLARLRLSAYGALGFLTFGLLASGLSGRQAGMDLAGGALKELLILVPCVLIASAMPARSRWGPVFYGFLIPILVVALMVTARMQD